VEASRSAARAHWRGQPKAFEEFLATMPDRYLFANAPEAVAAHARVAMERGSAPVYAAIVPSRHPEFAEICVVADDSPGLLARIAAALTAGRLEVLAAQVYSRIVRPSEQRRGVDGKSAAPPRDGGTRVEAVDLFWVRDRTEGAEGVGRAMPRLLRDLTDVCTGAKSPDVLLRERTGSASPWRERPSPAVLPEVVVDDRASPRHTVVEVFAKDRPGLLYTLADALRELGLSIALSKINTEGTKVADVFYVNELDGSKVASSERFKAIRDGILAAIGGAR
jgi:[protein-PII] uridylyltransferase